MNSTGYVCANAASTLVFFTALCGNGLESVGMAAVPDLRIAVALVDSANIPAAIRLGAKREAAHIFEKAGISTVWVDMNSDAPRELPIAAIVVRIVLEPDPAQPPAALGKSVVPVGGGGTNATIFFGRVRTYAAEPVVRETGADLGVVLGYAIAHEIGHLLLGANSHAESGLMSAVWTPPDMRSMALGHLEFQPDECARMRSEIARRNGRALPFAATKFC
jgi:hypothetical protein